MKIAPADRSTSAKENLISSALPSAAARTAESNSPHPPVGVPELSLATMYPSWSITRATGIAWAWYSSTISPRVNSMISHVIFPSSVVSIVKFTDEPSSISMSISSTSTFKSSLSVNPWPISKHETSFAELLTCASIQYVPSLRSTSDELTPE